MYAHKGTFLVSFCFPYMFCRKSEPSHQRTIGYFAMEFKTSSFISIIAKYFPGLAGLVSDVLIQKADIFRYL